MPSLSGGGPVLPGDEMRRSQVYHTPITADPCQCSAPPPIDWNTPNYPVSAHQQQINRTLTRPTANSFAWSLYVFRDPWYNIERREIVTPQQFQQRAHSNQPDPRLRNNPLG